MSQPIRMEYDFVSNMNSLVQEQIEKIDELQRKIELLKQDFQRIRNLTEAGWTRASTGNDSHKIGVLGAVLGMVEGIAEENLKDE